MSLVRLIAIASFILLSLASHAQDSIRIQSIYFGGGSYYIDQFQLEDLHNFINTIETPEKYQITITSHTDNIGGVAYNEWLSSMRGNAVIEELLSRLIERERIHVENRGLHDPLYDNNTNLGRRANRRVDVIFTPIVL